MSREPDGSAAPSGSSRSVVMPSLAFAREHRLVAERAGWFGAKNLLDSEPSARRHELALVVRALLHMRRQHDRQDDLSVALVERLVAASAQIPTRRLRSSSWQCVVAVHDRVARRCDACTFRPGKQICGGCGGGGSIRRGNDERDRMPCHACQRSGIVTCARCDGALAIQRVTVRTYEDRVAELEHVFLPILPIDVCKAVSDHLVTLDELPPELRVDLDRPATVPLGSYRTGSVISPPRFHGIDAVSVLPEATGTLKRLTAEGTLIERVVEAHAVPMCVLEYGASRVVVLDAGKPVAFVADQE